MDPRLDFPRFRAVLNLCTYLERLNLLPVDPGVEVDSLMMAARNLTEQYDRSDGQGPPQ